MLIWLEIIWKYDGHRKKRLNLQISVFAPIFKFILTTHLKKKIFLVSNSCQEMIDKLETWLTVYIIINYVNEVKHVRQTYVCTRVLPVYWIMWHHYGCGSKHSAPSKAQETERRRRHFNVSYSRYWVRSVLPFYYNDCHFHGMQCLIYLQSLGPWARMKFRAPA